MNIQTCHLFLWTKHYAEWWVVIKDTNIPCTEARSDYVHRNGEINRSIDHQVSKKLSKRRDVEDWSNHVFLRPREWWFNMQSFLGNFPICQVSGVGELCSNWQLREPSWSFIAFIAAKLLRKSSKYSNHMNDMDFPAQHVIHVWLEGQPWPSIHLLGGWAPLEPLYFKAILRPQACISHPGLSG